MNLPPILILSLITFLPLVGAIVVAVLPSTATRPAPTSASRTPSRPARTGRRSGR